ncbi:MAG TPA: PGF-pre-PGF domain-containing protein [Candidatus Nanoarchaeia archaeon]|nr:PGF-pre-PGF domain-containing protein [Candidatus Nanoarchaeia archaeon]
MRKTNLKTKKIINISLTLFVILLVIFSGPASAVKVTMTAPTGQHYSDQTVTFTVDIDFQTGDRIPIDNISITDLPKGDLSFRPDGTKISGDAGYTVTKIASADYGYGYGYGYDQNTVPGYGYDFGYGYGYGYDPINHKFRYEIKISGLTLGTHSGTANTKVNTGDTNKPSFSSSQSYSFEIISRPGSPSGRGRRGGSGGGGGGSSENWNNIDYSILARAYFSEGKLATFNFGSGTINSIELLSKGNYGLIFARVEGLNGPSGSIPTGNIPEGDILEYININVGNDGWSDGKVSDIVINFNIPVGLFEDSPTIIMYRFQNGEWQPLVTTYNGIEDGYYQFSVQTPGLSSFAIVIPHVSTDVEISQTTSDTDSTDVEISDGTESKTATKKGLPGFEILVGIVGILLAAYARKK